MLTLCTLTGVDARTDIGRILELSDAHPVAEFGILFSDTRGGGQDLRYPTETEIEGILDGMSKSVVNPNLALHICGKAVFSFMTPDHPIIDLAEAFGRVQLNFSAMRSDIDLSALDAAVIRFPGKVITQHNKANGNVWSSLSAQNHHVLFDTSGGRGLRSEILPSPLPGKMCGYAGGFGPLTIDDDLLGTLEAAQGQDYWIDMESSLRTDGVFDLDSCQRVLQATATFRTAHAQADAVVAKR